MVFLHPTRPEFAAARREFFRATACDVLFLDRAEVLPAHRTRGVGLMALLRTNEDFGRGCAVVVMKPLSLQLEGVKDTMAPPAADREYRRSMALDALEQDPTRARKSLERHGCKLGFKRLAGRYLA